MDYSNSSSEEKEAPPIYECALAELLAANLTRASQQPRILTGREISKAAWGAAKVHARLRVMGREAAAAVAGARTPPYSRNVSEGQRPASPPPVALPREAAPP